MLVQAPFAVLLMSNEPVRKVMKLTRALLGTVRKMESMAPDTEGEDIRLLRLALI